MRPFPFEKRSFCCFLAIVFSDAAAWACPPDIATVAVSGQSATGAGPGVVFSGFGTPGIGSTGQLLIPAVISGPGVTPFNDQGIWYGTIGSLNMAARHGSQAAGLPAGVNYTSLQVNTNGPPISGAGAIALQGNASDSTTCIWSGLPGSLGLAAQTNHQAPGTAAGVNFTALAQPVVNGSGHAAFVGILAGAGVTGSNNNGIWTGPASAMVLAARTGDQAHGMPARVTYTGFGSPIINAVGTICFFGTMSGPGVTTLNNSAIWVGSVGGIIPAIRKGDAAPGTPPGVTFADLSIFSSAPCINDGDRIAFAGTLTGPGVNSSNNTGIWLAGAGGDVMIARAGAPAPGLPAGVNFSGFTRPLISSGDQIVFRAGLTGTGVNSSNNNAIFAGILGSLQPVARTGDPAPGTPGLAFQSLEDPILNRHGQVAFRARTTIEFTDGIWISDPCGHLCYVTREGTSIEVAPGDTRTIGDVLFLLNASGGQDGRRSAFDDNGQITFLANFDDFLNSAVFTATLTPSGCVGDLNCDCVRSIADVDAFALALTDASAFALAFPGCDIMRADINGDMTLDGLDIMPFVQMFLAGGCP